MKSYITNNKNTLSLIDILIIFLNIAAGRGNYLLFGLTGLNKSTWVWGIVIIFDILYLCIRRIPFRLQKIDYSPFSIIFIMFLYNWLSIIIQGNGDFVTVTEITTIWVLFFIILQKLFFKLIDNTDGGLRKGVVEMSKGYIWLSFISIIGVFVSFLALNLGLVSGGTKVETDYMEANLAYGGTYEWTVLSINSIPDIDMRRIPFFQDYGVLTGLFHEPNIITHNITPCIILLIGLTGNCVLRNLAILSGILIMLFSASVTNVLVISVCLLVYVFVKFRSSFFVSLFTAAFAVAFVLLFIKYSDDTFIQFFIGRMDSGNASTSYTTSVIEHTFVPRTLFGYNFLSTSYIDEAGDIDRSLDVGVIIWALNISFLILYFRNIFKLIKKNNNVAMAVGLASLYYILHAAKGGMNMFFQLLPSLLIFLQLYVLNYGTIFNNKRSSYNRKEVKS